MKFIPERLEVAVGERITWVNRDIVPHTVTGKGVESGELGDGKSFSYVAKAPGEMHYICRLHPVMKGTIVVR